MLKLLICVLDLFQLQFKFDNLVNSIVQILLQLLFLDIMNFILLFELLFDNSISDLLNVRLLFGQLILLGFDFYLFETSQMTQL